MATKMCVRLKPYNPRAGYLLRRYTYRGIRIEEGKGWFKVPADVAEYLKTVRNEQDENSPLAFDVATEAEAQKLTELEFRKRVSRGQVGPNDAPTMKARETADQDRGGPSPRKRAGTDEPELGGDLNDEAGDLTTADLGRGKAPKAPKQRSTRAG